MSARGLGVAAAALLAALACGTNRSPEAEPDGPAATAPADTLEGVVRQVGSTPFPRTVVEGDTASATLTGPLAGELARAAGAVARVTGRRVEGDRPGRTLRVEGYDLLSVDGEEPRVGVLRHEAGTGYRLETGEEGSIALRAVSAGLGSAVGGKVWVVLGEGGAVQRYGILREP